MKVGRKGANAALANAGTIPGAIHVPELAAAAREALESRIGQAVTGGCINAGRFSMDVLLDRLNLGDLVDIASDSSCLP